MNQIRRFGSTANRSISNRHHIYDKILASTVFLQIFTGISFGIFFKFQNELTLEPSDGFDGEKSDIDIVTESWVPINVDMSTHFSRIQGNMGQFLQDGHFFLVYVPFFSISKFDFEILNKKILREF